MKNSKKLFIALAASCLFVAAGATADDGGEDVTICSLVPFLCGATTNGNGGGVQPPPKN